MSRIGGILLAAGASTRFGEPKQLATIGTETLINRAIRVMGDGACFPVVVVLGASADLIRERSNLHGVEVVFNPDWQEGMASSIRAGVRALPDVDGVIIMVCDMPAVTTSHLRALVETGNLMATSFVGRRGAPAYLPRSMFTSLMTLRGDVGARDLLHNAASIELPGGEFDIDTVSDLTAARKLFG